MYKDIVEAMRVTGLTAAHVQSHAAQYRSHEAQKKACAAAGRDPLPPRRWEMEWCRSKIEYNGAASRIMPFFSKTGATDWPAEYERRAAKNREGGDRVWDETAQPRPRLPNKWSTDADEKSLGYRRGVSAGIGARWEL